MLDDKPLVSIENLRVEFETSDGVVVGVNIGKNKSTDAADAVADYVAAARQVAR